MAEILPATHFIGWSKEQNDRCAEMMGHGFLIDSSDFLVEQWEEGEKRLAQLTDDERLQHDWILQAYKEDIGVHPRDRDKLDQLIDAELRNSCRRDLKAVIDEVNAQTDHHVHPSIEWVNPYQK